MQNFFIGKFTKIVIKSLRKLLLNQTCKTSVFQSHNPKVGGSNPSRATTFLAVFAAPKTPTASGRFVLVAQGFIVWTCVLAIKGDNAA